MQSTVNVIHVPIILGMSLLFERRMKNIESIFTTTVIAFSNSKSCYYKNTCIHCHILIHAERSTVCCW